jgi:membrane-bound lytic murein transglycosylase B
MLSRHTRRWPMRQLIAASSVILLVACAEKPTAADAQPLPVTPPRTCGDHQRACTRQRYPLEIQPAQSFSEWQADFRAQALKAGINPQVFDNAFPDITPDMSVIKADRSQPEFSRPVWEYLDGALSPLRVRNGQRLLEQNADLLSRIEAALRR